MEAFVTSLAVIRGDLADVGDVGDCAILNAPPTKN
jgi:hypothetical protein